MFNRHLLEAGHAKSYTVSIQSFEKPTHPVAGHPGAGFGLFAGIALATLSLQASDYPVASADAITRAMPQLRPGDSLIMADGPWENQAILVRAHGNSNAPITLRARTPGKTVLTGKSSLTIEGAYVVVSGLAVRDGAQVPNGILLTGSHCRLTECSVTDSTYKFYVHLAGTENRMDHCYLAGKTSESPTLQIEVGEMPNHHRVDHNHFGPRPPLGRNGGETIRVGYSWQSMSNSATVVEQNLFDRCDGELEIISNKSCENIYRHNTFVDCAGTLTLRHGNRCRVEGNFFLAHHKRGSGGIRVIGDHHVILNNYIDGVTQGGIWITAGIPDSPLKGYFLAEDILIAFNTVVDCGGSCVDLSAGLGSAGRTLLPRNITIANNLFSPEEGQPLLKGSNTSHFTWRANLASTEPTKPLPPEFRSLNLKLKKSGDDLWRPMPDSPARGAAEGRTIAVPIDLDGQPRSGSLDIGADQGSSAPVTYHPLSPGETGPSWLDRKIPPRE